MSDRLHIIIAGDEGKIRNLLLSRRKLKLYVSIIGIIFIGLSIIAFNTVSFFQSNRTLNNQVAKLSRQLQETSIVKDTLTQQIQDLQGQNNNNQEKADLLNSTITELEERSGLIKRIMCNIGIDVKDVPTNNNNSGGPFISPLDTIGKDLLFRSDHYMETINYLPLGRPLPGHITSRFGHRIDPVNGKKGFHTGIDIKGRIGQKIIATADGKVTKSFVNGSYGQYIEINHGNGYTTKFAHLSKRLVKRGERVTRGQTIGAVGNSGRSTGAHLHYEVCLSKKPLNPIKFMRVDKLLKTPFIPRLTTKKMQKIKHNIITKNLASTPAVLEN